MQSAPPNWERITFGRCHINLCGGGDGRTTNACFGCIRLEHLAIIGGGWRTRRTSVLCIDQRPASIKLLVNTVVCVGGGGSAQQSLMSVGGQFWFHSSTFCVFWFPDRKCRLPSAIGATTRVLKLWAVQNFLGWLD